MNKQFTKEQCSSIADQLEAVNAKLNEGRGVHTATMMIRYLRKGHLSYAIAEHHLDGDKTRFYPALEKVINDTLGCRSHHVVGCKKPSCEKLYKLLCERINA